VKCFNITYLDVTSDPEWIVAKTHVVGKIEHNTAIDNQT